MDYLFSLFGTGDDSNNSGGGDQQLLFQDSSDQQQERPSKRPRLDNSHGGASTNNTMQAQQTHVPVVPQTNNNFGNNNNAFNISNNSSNNNVNNCAPQPCVAQMQQLQQLQQLIQQQQQQQLNASGGGGGAVPPSTFPPNMNPVQMQQHSQQLNTASFSAAATATSASTAPTANTATGGTTVSVPIPQSLLVQSAQWVMPPTTASVGSAVTTISGAAITGGAVAQQQQPLQPLPVVSSAPGAPAALLPALMPQQQLKQYQPPYDPVLDEKERVDQKKRKNAEQARRSREKKRNMEVVIRLELRELQRENDHLKSIVKNHISDKAQQIIGECCYKQHENDHSLFQSNLNDQSSKMNNTDFELIEGLTKNRQSFVLTDPRLPDNPIVYASASFLELTGYAKNDVLGRNCRFLQGVDTDHRGVSTIRKAIEKGVDGAACLKNYKADGTMFWNHLFIAALHDGENRIVNYVSRRVTGGLFHMSCVL